MPIKKVLVIGGATLDTLIEYENMETMVHKSPKAEQSYLLLEEGKKIEVSQQTYVSGGGGTNTAVSFKRQGFDVSLMCKIGDDALGKVVLAELKAHNIPTALVKTSGSRGTGSSFVVPSLKGDRTVFAYRGANTTLLHKELPLNEIEQHDFVYITSLSQESSKRLPDIALGAKEQQKTVAINPGMSQLTHGSLALKSALPNISMLILNLDEAKQFMLSLVSEDKALKAELQNPTPNANTLYDKSIYIENIYFSLRHFFTKVMELGPAIVAVTDGANGVYVATPENLYYHPAMKETVVNTLGAGDAFGSGFVGTYQLTQNIEEAIRKGIANSASVVAYSDAKKGLLNTEDLAKKAATIAKEKLEVFPW